MSSAAQRKIQLLAEREARRAAQQLREEAEAQELEELEQREEQERLEKEAEERRKKEEAEKKAREEAAEAQRLAEEEAEIEKANAQLRLMTEEQKRYFMELGRVQQGGQVAGSSQEGGQRCYRCRKMNKVCERPE